MDVGIIICTYNRAESLRESLHALQRQQMTPLRNWEVIVVDNNSNDHTSAVVEEMQRRWPALRYAFEKEQGLPNARNHGIKIAQGDVLLFTDDDVLPEPDWIEQALSGLYKYNADACGGYIAPIWETQPPAWLSARFYGFLAARTDSTEDYVITEPGKAPFGANMAFKRNVFDRVGLFDKSLGRKGKLLSSGEDGEMFERILGAGLKVVFLGNSRVHHKVESFRVTKRYFRNWRFQTGRNIVQSRGISGERQLCHIPLYIFPQFVRAVLRVLWGRMALPSDEAINRENVCFSISRCFPWLMGNTELTC